MQGLMHKRKVAYLSSAYLRVNNFSCQWNTVNSIASRQTSNKPRKWWPRISSWDVCLLPLLKEPANVAHELLLNSFTS